MFQNVIFFNGTWIYCFHSRNINMQETIQMYFLKRLVSSKRLKPSPRQKRAPYQLRQFGTRAWTLDLYYITYDILQGRSLRFNPFISFFTENECVCHWVILQLHLRLHFTKYLISFSSGKISISCVW